MWGVKKTKRKLDPANAERLLILHAANDALPESRRMTATLVWVAGMLLSEDAVTRELGQGALVRVAEWLL